MIMVKFFSLLFLAVDVVMEVQRSKPSINHRFSSLRYMRVVKQFNPIQRGYISRRNMGNLLHIPNHLMVPLSLLQWLVDHIVYGSGGVFKKKNKTIHFTKHIVDKVFGFESGTIPYALASEDPVIVGEVEALRMFYAKGKHIPIKHLDSILLGTNNEVVFMRSFVLYFITTVLCPSTYNFVNPKFLYALTHRDMHQVQELDLGNLCIGHLFEEIDTWKDRVFNGDGDYNRETWIGGCLPVLAVCFLNFCMLSFLVSPFFTVCMFLWLVCFD